MKELFFCRRVLNRNRDKYICLQNQKVCNKCIESGKLKKLRHYVFTKL